MATVKERQTELAGLAGLRRQFGAWRTRKGSGEAIPQKLWQGAGELARRHGAGKVALALGLDSHKLRQVSLGRWPARGLKRAEARLPARGKPNVPEGGFDTQFIELKAPVGTSAPLEGEAVVEVLGADGTRITLRLKDSSPALPGVIAALRGRS